MQGLHLIETAFRNLDGGKLDPAAPDAPESRAFLEALLETDALKDSGLTLEDLEAWLASQGGKGLPLGGHDLPTQGQGGESAALARGAKTDGVEPAVEFKGGLEDRAGVQQAEQDEALLQDLLAMGGMNPLAGQGSDALKQQEDLVQTGGRSRHLQFQQLGNDAAQARADAETPISAQRGRGAQAQFQQTLQSAMPQSGGVPTYTVSQPMDQSGWGQALGERLTMMAKQDVQHARIQMNPRELGPLDVRIQMGEDKTSIVFQAQNAVTREALEAELPRLRMMLSDNGIEDAEVNVDQQETMTQNDEGERPEGYARGDTEDGEGGDDTAGAADADMRPRGLVDHYA